MKLTPQALWNKLNNRSANLHMGKKVKKALIPAAGFGTRFLPQTKAMPKEMLPIVDKPVIQYVVEEAVASGIEDIIVVTGANKRAIEDHFDIPNQDLVQNLMAGGKEKILEEVKKIADMANFIYVRQKGPYGNDAKSSLWKSICIPCILMDYRE